MYFTVRIERVGLCSTCINSVNCIYRARRGFDAIYCEMFCIEADSTKQSDDFNEERLILPGVQNSYSASFKGLCQNCQNRDGCLLPRPEEGVWHCEEYM